MLSSKQLLNIRICGKLLLELAAILFVCSCKMEMPALGKTEVSDEIHVKRFDRLQYQYITTADFSALQQMNTEFPTETRTLIENVLKIGHVDESQIMQRFLSFYQDTTLLAIVLDVEQVFADTEPLSNDLTEAFRNFHNFFPEVSTPTVYAQIGALNQSIIINDGSIGISLDKYLGADYSTYKRFFSKEQRQEMNAENIVPDCVLFYLLSLYPLKNFPNVSQDERDDHMGKCMWITNRILERKAFDNPLVDGIQHYVDKHPDTEPRDLLEE